MRRYNGRMNGEQYLGNIRTKEIHNLDCETTMCQIDEIIVAANEKPFVSKYSAEILGYDNCHYCIGSSQR